MNQIAARKTKATKYNSPKRLAAIGANVIERLNAHPRVQWLESPYAQIYAHQNFLSDAECAYFINRINENAQPSTLYSGTEQEGFRTSYSCNVDINDPQINDIDQKICDLFGIPVSHSEILQGQRYEVGQQFKPHHDFFHEEAVYWKKEARNGGQRSWTAMVFLNEPEEGGETDFTQLEYKVPPRKGMLLAWNNMLPDGRPNMNTLHAGTPIVRGTKYIITKWFRLNRWEGRPVE